MNHNGPTSSLMETERFIGVGSNKEDNNLCTSGVCSDGAEYKDKYETQYKELALDAISSFLHIHHQLFHFQNYTHNHCHMLDHH